MLLGSSPGLQGNHPIRHKSPAGTCQETLHLHSKHSIYLRLNELRQLPEPIIKIRVGNPYISTSAKKVYQIAKIVVKGFPAVGLHH